MDDQPLTGFVIQAISGFYTVLLDSGEEVVCRLPGKLKQTRQQTDIVAVGDRVTIHKIDNEKGLIDEVFERQNALARTRPSGNSRQWQQEKEQVLVANVDQIVIVNALKKPVTNLRKLDRMLVVAEEQDIPAVIVVNKVDLGSEEKAHEIFGLYEQIGYPVLYVSAKTGLNVSSLKTLLKGRISVLTGSSGVGKSSLLNAIQPGLGLAVHAVSESTDKGLHTTRFARLIPLEEGGFVADTPGIRGWALFNMEPEEIDGYFREIAPLVSNCQFSDCTHRHEPGCAVLAAVAAGEVDPGRYDSYLRLREEHEALLAAAFNL